MVSPSSPFHVCPGKVDFSCLLPGSCPHTLTRLAGTEALRCGKFLLHIHPLKKNFRMMAQYMIFKNIFTLHLMQRLTHFLTLLGL